MLRHYEQTFNCANLRKSLRIVHASENNEKEIKENPVLFWTVPTHERCKISRLLEEDTSGDGTEEGHARADLEAGGSTGGRGGIGGRSASALETGIVGRGASGGAARGRSGGSKSGHAHGGVAGDGNAGARSASGSANGCDEDRDRGGAAERMLAVVVTRTCSILLTWRWEQGWQRRTSWRWSWRPER